jgi:sugar lactone lactonase YvrE
MDSFGNAIGDRMEAGGVYVSDFQNFANFFEKKQKRKIGLDRLFRVDPVPCLVTLWDAYMRAHDSVVWSAIGKASTYFENPSVNVNKYLFRRWVTG